MTSPIEAMAKAIMIAKECGDNIGGERVFCDHPEAISPHGERYTCDCRKAARAALLALAEVELPGTFYEASARAAIAAKDDEEPNWILGVEMQREMFRAMLRAIAEEGKC